MPERAALRTGVAGSFGLHLGVLAALAAVGAFAVHQTQKPGPPPVNPTTPATKQGHAQRTAQAKATLDKLARTLDRLEKIEAEQKPAQEKAMAEATRRAPGEVVQRLTDALRAQERIKEAVQRDTDPKPAEADLAKAQERAKRAVSLLPKESQEKMNPLLADAERKQEAATKEATKLAAERARPPVAPRLKPADAAKVMEAVRALDKSKPADAAKAADKPKKADVPKPAGPPKAAETARIAEAAKTADVKKGQDPAKAAEAGVKPDTGKRTADAGKMTPEGNAKTAPIKGATGETRKADDAAKQPALAAQQVAQDATAKALAQAKTEAEKAAKERAAQADQGAKPTQTAKSGQGAPQATQVAQASSAGQPAAKATPASANANAKGDAGKNQDADPGKGNPGGRKQNERGQGERAPGQRAPGGGPPNSGKPGKGKNSANGKSRGGGPEGGRPGAANPSVSNSGGGNAGGGSYAGPATVGLGETYAAARGVEARISQTYGRMRARQLGTALGASPETVKSLAEIPNPMRPDLDLPETGGKLAEERRAVAEMQAMAARAQRLLDQAQAAAGTDAAVFAAQATAAASRQSGDARDLTGIGGIGGGYTPDTVTRTQRLPGDPVAGQRMGVVPAIAALDIARAVPGNRIAAGGAPSTNWLLVDSWYWLGPFPNDARKNLTTPLGPEKGVDLDATYPGKGGKTLHWQFRQSQPGVLIPPDAQEYGIYYAYAEVTSDRDRDLWIAIGSDDQSTMYLNGKIVWISTSDLKAWNPGEGLRRVHFVKGRNRLLFRLENGWRGTGMSVAVSLHDKPAAHP